MTFEIDEKNNTLCISNLLDNNDNAISVALRCVVSHFIACIYDKLKDKEGEWELEECEDDIFDILHNKIDEYVCEEYSESDKIVYEYGLNKIYKEYIEEYESVNIDNVVGCLAYKIIYDKIRDINNSFFVDIIKFMIEKRFDTDSIDWDIIFL